MASGISAAATPPAQGNHAIADLLNDAVRLTGLGDGQGALAAYNRILELAPDDFDLINRIGSTLCAQGSLEQARPFVERAYALAPGNRDVRTALMQLYRSLSTTYFYRTGNIVGATDVIRRLLAFEPNEATDLQINLVDCLWRIGEKALLSDFTPAVKPEDIGKHILVACMPKSGSSFLMQVLYHLTGYERVPFAFAYMRNEQDLYLPQLLRYARRNTVTQQHCRATQPNVALLQAFGIRPVILVRNIHDIVVSLTDFYDHGAVYNSFLFGHWELLSPSGRIDAVIDHIVPWYLSFYASWVETCERKQLDALFVTYEDMIADKPGTISAVARFLDIAKSDADCAIAVARAEGETGATRKNQGVSGRGASRLTDEQKARIARLTEAYVNTDFSLIGAA